MSIWSEIKRLWKGKKTGELSETTSVIPSPAVQPATSPTSGGKCQRSKQSGAHCHGAFGHCKGPFDESKALNPEEMRIRYAH